MSPKQIQLFTLPMCAVLISLSVAGCSSLRSLMPVNATPQPTFTAAQKDYYAVGGMIGDNDLAGLEKLIKANPKLAKVQGSYGTPLHWAVDRGKPRIVEFLLKSGADVNARVPNNASVAGQSGDTPLLFAVTGRTKPTKTRIVEMLLSHGANVNAANTINGATPLWSAATTGDLVVTKLLLSHGAKVNLATKKGDTPLQGVLQQQKMYARDSQIAAATAPFVNRENYPQIIAELRKAGAR